uniref:N-V protease (Fragments) n=1 Tax=Alitta virens TaxID=880429 RepID=NVSP_ALIVI|nr:RecName: Full=N-V protease [Alitta virens]
QAPNYSTASYNVVAVKINLFLSTNNKLYIHDTGVRAVYLAGMKVYLAANPTASSQTFNSDTLVYILDTGINEPNYYINLY